MNIQVVAVRETGTSEILPLSPDTLRVFLVLGAPSKGAPSIPPAQGRPGPAADPDTVRRFDPWLPEPA